MSETKRIGKYELLEEIGRGGFATVYKARDNDLDRIVALKVLHPYWTADPAFAARFRREARAAANLWHPHIVTIYDAGETAGQLYIAMEYLQGRTLQALLEAEGRLSLEKALPILVQLAEALDYAHGESLVHRDVKPANIIIKDFDNEPRVVLTDFGLVKALATSSALTSQGTLLGSPEYMAPEQADPEHALDVGPAADLYALGIIAYQMLTGRVPFPGNTPATLNAHENKPVPPPRDLCPELSEPVSAALLKMLAKAPEERFCLAGDFVASLRAAHLEQRQKSQLEALYEQLHVAEEEARWEDVLKLGGQILALQPNDRDLQRRMAHAQAQLVSSPAKKLTWGWILGGVAALTLLIVGLSRDRGKQIVIPTLPPTAFPEKTASLSTSIPTSAPTSAPISTPTSAPTSTPTSAPTSTSTLASGDTRFRAADGMVMVYVPAGEFEMGSFDGDSNESPVHLVSLDGFWLDRITVTNAQYERCVAAGSCEPSRSVNDPDFNGSNYPVVGVLWYDAVAYCAWVGARLPTEAEWEYAARGTAGWVYPWGNDFDCSLGNLDDETEIDTYVVPGGAECDGYDRTAPVGSFPEGASWCGALDMIGNVWEWVSDWLSLSYSHGQQVNPTGPASGDFKVLRGGSWANDSGPWLRGADRHGGPPDNTSNEVGFRCVLTQPPDL